MQIATTALILASKFDDVEPVYISDVMRTVPATRRHKLSLREVLALEVEFLEILKDFIAPTATAFAHRYSCRLCDVQSVICVDIFKQWTWS